MVLIKRSLLFVFGNFGQALNGFYETARMAAKNTFYVHLFRYRIAAVVLRAVHCQFDSCVFPIRKSSMNNRFGGDI